MIVLIGLPATGKSTISSHLIQCLKNNPLTNSLRCKVFNAGKIRRQISCATISKPLLLSNTSSEDLFNPKITIKRKRMPGSLCKSCFTKSTTMNVTWESSTPQIRPSKEEDLYLRRFVRSIQMSFLVSIWCP